MLSIGDKAAFVARSRRVAYEAFCTLLAFVLTFSCSFSLQTAFALAADAGSASSASSTIAASASAGSGTEAVLAVDGGSGEGSDAGGSSDQAPTHYVDDISVTLLMNEREVTLGYASSGDEPDPIELTKQGQTGDLYGIAWWNDDTYERNPTGMEFHSSDDAIVTVDRDGKIIARGDGEAEITVSMTKNTLTGDPIELVVPVYVSGQSGKTITGISIHSSAYATDDIYLDDTRKSEVHLQFYAVVTLEDGTSLSTEDGKLSAQDPDLEDLCWEVSDSQIAAVEPATGEYRQREYGLVNVFACSSDYRVMSNSISVTVEDPDGDSEAHTQDTLTVHIEYEEAPEGAITIEDKQYSRADLGALGTMTETYTLIGKSGAAQATGYGVSVRNLLVDACETAQADGLDAIASVQFLSGADRANYTASIDALFTTRYTYDPASYVAGISTIVKSVEPMLAFESNWLSVYSVVEGKDKGLSDATQFRLLMGSASFSDSTSGYSIKWINRINVTLKGSAPVNPDNGDDPNNNPDADNKNEDKKTDPSQQNQVIANGGTGGAGTGGSGSSGAGDGIGIAGIGSGVGDQRGSGVQSNEVGTGQGAYSIYQIMNPYTTNLDIQYAQNPFKPFVVPVCLAAFVAGLVQLSFWYARQRRPLEYRDEQPLGGTA